MSDTTEEMKNFYGINAPEWLRRWDEGHTVWSVEMGGLGPGYEQAIQIAAAEVVRCLLARGESPESDEEWATVRAELDTKLFSEGAPLNGYGYSGAQVGAAYSLGFNIFKRWPDCILDEEIEDRKIQVSKNFPSIEDTADD